MKKLVKVDNNGYLVFGEDLFIYPITNDEGNESYDIPDGYTDIHYDGGYFKPRLVDGVWVEDRPFDDIEAERLLVSLQPTTQELADADLEIKVLTLLIEMGVI